MITVSKDNTGDYTSIQEAVDAISSSTVSETIFIKNGTYNERVEITHNNITLIGESMDNVIITKDYYALMTMPDNTKRGTFRSYTFFVHANNFHAYNITFVNSSGFGTEVGQAIAVYAEGDNITFKNCKLLGHQDTLFTGPLPLKEKQPGGLASISGTVIGVFIIALLQEGILALGFTKDYQLIITGLIVIVAVFSDVVARRRKN